LHEQKQIEGRPAGERACSYFHLNIADTIQASRSSTTLSRFASFPFPHPRLPLPSLKSTQNAAEACTTEQLAELDTKILDLRAQTTTLLATAKTLRSTLSSLNSTLSTADLIANVHALETEEAAILARLDGLKKGKAKKVGASLSPFLLFLSFPNCEG
jgi:hypothetical protein